MGLAVGVEDRPVDLVGVEDLTAGPAGLEEGRVDREVGVEGLEDLAVVVKVGRPVGVAALALDDRPPDDGCLLSPGMEEFAPDCKVGFLDTTLLFDAGSSWIFASCNPTAK